MIRYESTVRKAIERRKILIEVAKTMHNAFRALESTGDFRPFDVKEMKGNYNHRYFRLRKGKYRAIFYAEGGDLYVVHVGKREEVYRLWE